MLNPIFTSQRLCLAIPSADDAEAFAQWTNSDTYMRLLDDDPVRPQSPANFDHFGNARGDDDYYFHLRTLEEDVLLGFVVLFNLKWRNQTAELAIGIGNTDYRGKGYGQEALHLILNYAFSELNLRRVSLTVIDYNTVAINAYKKVGFQQEGTARQAIIREDKTHDLLHFGILRHEYQASDTP
ncbi:MAG: GNAT family protein [Chloroflexota bacterium]